MNEAEEFIWEGNAREPGFAEYKAGTLTEYAENIGKQKNPRLLVSICSLITAVLCGVLFTDMFQSGISSYAYLYAYAAGTVISFAFLLWIVSGVDCFWNSSYQFSRRSFYAEQLSFFIIAAVEQMFVGYIIPQICIQGTFTWNLPLYYSIWGAFFVLAAAELILLMRGRWQSYFSLIQMIGIMISLAAFELRINDIVDTPELLLIQPLILPYDSSLILCAALYCYLNRKIVRNAQMR